MLCFDVMYMYVHVQTLLPKRSGKEGGLRDGSGGGFIPSSPQSTSTYKVTNRPKLRAGDHNIHRVSGPQTHRPRLLLRTAEDETVIYLPTLQRKHLRRAMGEMRAKRDRRMSRLGRLE